MPREFLCSGVPGRVQKRTTRRVSPFCVNKIATIGAPPLSSSSHRLQSPAFLTLDGDGVIQSASPAAESFWLCSPNALAGLPLASLLIVQPSSGPVLPEPKDWEILRTAALNRPVILKARIPDQTTAEVSVRLEEARGDAARYFAYLEDPIQRRDSAPPLLVDSGLSLLADQGAIGFFDLNFKEGQVYYSPAWKRGLGYNESEIANTYDSWLRLLHPEDSEGAPDHAAKRRIAGVRSFSVEVRMLHRRGHYTWVHCLGTQVFGPRGDLERVTGLQIDISERKEVEEQQLVNEERVQRLSQEGELALFDLNFATQQFWFSPSWRPVIGETLEGVDALNSFVEALPSELALSGAQSFFVEPQVGQPVFVTSLRLTQQNGTSFIALFGAHRQLSRKGDLLRAVGFCCRIPATITELALTPFPASLVDAVLGAFTEALIVADSSGSIIYLNGKAEFFTGVVWEVARTMKLQEIFRLVTRKDGTPADGALDSALSSTEPARMSAEHALLAFEQSNPRPIIWSARRVSSTRGPASIAIVFRDPDEMNLTPEELLKINRFETLGIVAGGISHDFNNLLTTILGGISQAKDNGDSSFLADSERACMAAKALTKQLLAFAKGGKSEAIQTLALADLIRDAARLARAGTSAEIRIDVPDTVSPICVDRAQILQVFQNLIINSLQALPARGGTVWLSAVNATVKEEDPDLNLNAGAYVRVEVRDNGSGIAPEHLEKIFEPFFTTKKHGTGLGLPMVRGIIRRYGGDVLVTSTVGAGTTFQIYIPQAKNKTQTVETRAAPTLRFGTGRILLMDDDPDICRLTEGMLSSLDYQCDVARNSNDAIALYRKHLNVGRPYDAVLLDLTVIGGPGGEETFHQLKALDPNVRAVVCSGYDSDDMVQHFTDLGFYGYLAKPFRASDLGRVLKEVLGDRGPKS